jgi:hypothetical protein
MLTVNLMPLGVDAGQALAWSRTRIACADFREVDGQLTKARFRNSAKRNPAVICFEIMNGKFSELPALFC